MAANSIRLGSDITPNDYDDNNANETTSMMSGHASGLVPPGYSVHEDVEVIANISSSHNRVVAIAVDGGWYSDYAFKWAIENIVKPESDLIVLLNVRPPVIKPHMVGPLYVMNFSNELNKLEVANKKASHDLIRSFASKLPHDKRYNVKGVALRGDAREELSNSVTNLGADMLIVGSRGLGAVKRAFLGSVSDYLVKTLEIPVIVPRIAQPST